VDVTDVRGDLYNSKELILYKQLLHLYNNPTVTIKYASAFTVVTVLEASETDVFGIHASSYSTHRLVS